LKRRVLIVEDDLALRVGLRDALLGEGFDVTVASDGDEGHELLLTRRFDLVLLDLMLPGRGGLALLRELRSHDRDTEVLVLTAKGDESDRVLGLELGADDYVTKPFSLRELIARVRARLRRREKGEAAPLQFALGAAEVDLEAFQVKVGGRVHPLSPKEAAMLALLWRERGAAVSRNRFLDEVWGSEQFVGTRTIDTHVLNLRAKLEPDPARPRFLLTVHGVGYRLEA
jgi:DNA-binding response OmpR family regulator